MSSSGDTAPQRRDPTVHSQHGQLLTKVCYPRSTDIDLRQTYPRARQIGTPSAPTAATLPPTEAVAFTARPEIHKDQRYRTTAFPMKRAPVGKSHPDPEFRPTKTIGKENRNEWKTPKLTDKVQARRDKAAAWLETTGKR